MLKEIRTLGFKYQNPNLLATIKEGGSNGKRQNLKEKGKKLEQDLTFDDLKLIRKQVCFLMSFQRCWKMGGGGKGGSCSSYL